MRLPVEANTNVKAFFEDTLLYSISVVFGRGVGSFLSSRERQGYMDTFLIYGALIKPFYSILHIVCNDTQYLNNKTIKLDIYRDAHLALPDNVLNGALATSNTVCH